MNESGIPLEDLQKIVGEETTESKNATVEQGRLTRSITETAAATIFNEAEGPFIPEQIQQALADFKAGYLIRRQLPDKTLVEEPYVISTTLAKMLPKEILTDPRRLNAFVSGLTAETIVFANETNYTTETGEKLLMVTGQLLQRDHQERAVSTMANFLKGVDTSLSKTATQNLKELNFKSFLRLNSQALETHVSPQVATAAPTAAK